MAKQKMTADEQVEVDTLERKIVAEEALETLGVVVPDPVAPVAPELDPVAAWLAEARDAHAVFSTGNVVSGETLKRLVSSAMGLLSR